MAKVGGKAWAPPYGEAEIMPGAAGGNNQQGK